MPRSSSSSSSSSRSRPRSRSVTCLAKSSVGFVDHLSSSSTHTEKFHIVRVGSRSFFVISADWLRKSYSYKDAVKYRTKICNAKRGNFILIKSPKDKSRYYVAHTLTHKPFRSYDQARAQQRALYWATTFKK